MTCSPTNIFLPVELKLTMSSFLPYYFPAICCYSLFHSLVQISSVWEEWSEKRGGHTSQHRPWPLLLCLVHPSPPSSRLYPLMSSCTGRMRALGCLLTIVCGLLTCSSLPPSWPSAFIITWG